jgi:hypothetical protein
MENTVTMTNRERMTRFIKGLPTDRTPFVQYDNIGAPNEEIWNALGRENMGISIWTEAYRLVNEHCSMKIDQITRNRKVVNITTLQTPVGTLYQERVPVPGIPKVTNINKHFVTSLEDYKIILAYLSDIRVVENREKLKSSWNYVGDDGLPHTWIGRTPFQELWVNWVSMIDLSFHLMDDPILLDEVMALFGDITLQAAAVSAQVADAIEIPYIVIGDNITAPLIGPKRFAKYCLPYYQKVAKLFAEKEIPLVVHMDGDLKPLWSLIGESGVGGLDSFSPPPDNDTSVAEANSMWPDMRLMLNFPSSVHLGSEEEIYQKTVELLNEAGDSGQLQIQISENPPPGCWRKSYPQIIRAIEEFSRN